MLVDSSLSSTFAAAANKATIYGLLFWSFEIGRRVQEFKNETMRLTAKKFAFSIGVWIFLHFKLLARSPSFSPKFIHFRAHSSTETRALKNRKR
jgi:hypothetical protein